MCIRDRHNPQCMVSLAAAIREYLPGQPVTVLTGVLADKDYGCLLYTSRCV